MTERPILFSAPMVRAILDGRKTQTRREGKIQRDTYTELSVNYIGHATKGFEAVATYRAFPGRGTARWGICACPYGVPGDRLWVRETWQSGDYALNEPRGAVYRATDPDWETIEGWQWKPSIHMPRWASRIILEITAVRVERLRDISLADVFAEGCCLSTDKADLNDFQNLWESINGAGSWQKNPWVFVIEFKRILS